MKVHIKSKYVDEEVELVFEKYGNGSTAISGRDPRTGEPLFKATVAFPALPVVRINHQLSVIRKEC